MSLNSPSVVYLYVKYTITFSIVKHALILILFVVSAQILKSTNIMTSRVSEWVLQRFEVSFAEGILCLLCVEVAILDFVSCKLENLTPDKESRVERSHSVVLSRLL
jgi:hypothetical protein